MVTSVDFPSFSACDRRTHHNQSVLIVFLKQKQTAKERRWLLVSADVRGAGTRDEPLRTSAWEAKVAVGLDLCKLCTVFL